MKATELLRHSWGAVEVALQISAKPKPLDVAAVCSEHIDFVWLTLQRFGVRDADLEDALQEVFIVVHRRLGEFDGRAKITTWLYAISQRVAMATRRNTRAHHVSQMGEVPEVATGLESDPEHMASQREARVALDAVLDTLDPERRAVFVMFELEGIECREIAEMCGVPVGTVYSRLHHARKDFERAAARMRARQVAGGAIAP